MAIKFDFDWGITSEVREIIEILEMKHVRPDNVICMRSHNSGARGTIARCYGLTRIWQKALGVKAHYIIEVINNAYEKQNDEDKKKTLIHELMHIPFNFGGGFKHHSNYVTTVNVNKMYKQFIMTKRLKDQNLI